MARFYSIFPIVLYKQGESFLNNKGVIFVLKLLMVLFCIKKNEENKYLDVFLGFSARITEVFSSGEVVPMCIVNR